MLKQILQEIANGYGHSQSTLARRLDISEGLLAQMMNELARKGYLAPLANETREKIGACQGCKLHAACAGCAINKPPMLAGWVLTAKGRRAAEG
jgi:hypothetical protein